MPEHELLLRINATLMKICEDIGELKSGQKATAQEVKGLREDLMTVCGEVDSLKKDRNIMLGGSKVIVAVCGVISAGISIAISFFRSQS